MIIALHNFLRIFKTDKTILRRFKIDLTFVLLRDNFNYYTVDVIID